MMRRPARWIALGFFVAAVVLFGLGFWKGRSGAVLSMPLQLTPGANLTRDFTVPFTAAYEVSVQFARAIPHERLTELLSGDNIIDAEVVENGRKLSVRKYFPPPRPSVSPWYKLASDNPTTDIGNLVFSNDWIAQTVVSFSAERGRHYRVLCNVVRTNPDLLKANPTLVIAIESAQIKDSLIPTALLLFGGIAAAVCALVAGSIYLVQVRKN
jgi:hypothetical protein